MNVCYNCSYYRMKDCYCEKYLRGKESAVFLCPECKSADDLITRRAAYETLTEYYHHTHFSQHIELKNVLDRVPSAQPEVITCEHCKYRERVDGYARFTRSQYYCGFEYERCDPYEMTRNANDPDYFCADAERKQE